jgi:uncharacterized protein involved in cysteine biosynthesis
MVLNKKKDKGLLLIDVGGDANISQTVALLITSLVEVIVITFTFLITNCACLVASFCEYPLIDARRKQFNNKDAKRYLIC